MLRRCYQMTCKIPKNLRLKVVPKEQALWENVAKEAQMLINQSNDNLKIQTELLKVAKAKIESFK